MATRFKPDSRGWAGMAVAFGIITVAISATQFRPPPKRYVTSDVTAAFSKSGVRLTAGERPLSTLLPRALFASRLRTYVLVWPSASAMRKVHAANGRARTPNELYLENVEFSLPANPTPSERRRLLEVRRALAKS